MSDKTTIGVFFGSDSPAHDASIDTACEVVEALRRIGFRVVPVYISRDGAVYLGEVTDEKSDVLAQADYFQNDLQDKLAKLTKYQLPVSQMNDGLRFNSSSTFSSHEVKIDVAFTCLGGRATDNPFGNLFSLAGVATVGSSLQASAVTADTALTKLLFQQFDIPTTDFIYITDQEWGSHKKELLESVEYLKLPYIVRPARSRSVGASTQVDDVEQLPEVIDAAFLHDTKVIIEEGIERVANLSVSVRGSDTLAVSDIQETRFGGKHSGHTNQSEREIIIPAEISTQKTRETKTLAARIFQAFELSGIATIHFLLDRNGGAIYANEIITMPHMISKRLWEKSGVSFSDVLRELIRDAQKEHRRQKNVSGDARSDMLKNVADATVNEEEAINRDG